jgi:hypothetical protein
MSFFCDQNSNDVDIGDVQMWGIDEDEFVSGFLVPEFKITPQQPEVKPDQQAADMPIVNKKPDACARVPRAKVPKKLTPAEIKQQQQAAFLENMPVTFMCTKELMMFLIGLENVTYSAV